MRASSAILDQLSFGIVQLGPRGTVVAVNRAGEKILGRKDGLSLTRLGVRASSPRDDSRLQLAIARAGGVTAAMADQGDAGGHLRVQRPSGARPYTVVVSPLGLDRVYLSLGQPIAMLIITDPDAGPQLDERAMQSLFGFTPAEARLVNLLVTGASLPDIAKRLGIAFETARTQLAHARAKTETASQADLVRAVLTALAPVDQPPR